MTGASHAARWAVVAALVWAACAWLDTRQTADLVQESAAYVTGGGATWVLQAPGAISGRACDDLASAQGIHAAGAIRAEAQGLRLAVWPSAPLPQQAVTPGFLAVLGAPAASGVALPDGVIERLGLTPPAPIASRDGPVTVGARYSYPDDGRRTGLGYAVISPTVPDRPFDECWVTLWPTTEATKQLIWTAVTPQAADNQAQPPTLGQLNPTFASSFDAVQAFNRRPTRPVPLAALVAGAVIGATAQLTRRLDLAAELHTGMPKAAVLAHLTLETAVWVAAAALLATPAVLAAAHGVTWDQPGVVRLGLRPILAGAGGALLGVLAAATVRERRLFALFKRR